MTVRRFVGRWAKLSAAFAVVLAGLTLSACGASSSSTGTEGDSAAVPAEITNAVKAAEAPLDEWPGPNKKFSMPAGKKIMALICAKVTEGCAEGGEGVAAAAAAAGWSANLVDGQGDPGTWNSAIQNAVAQGVDGIVLVAVPPALVTNALAKAKSADIPVVSMFIPHFPGTPNVDAYVSTDHPEGGKIMADWIIQDSNGSAHVIVFNEPQFPELMERNQAMVDELNAKCPNCQIEDEVDFNVGTMAEKLPQSVISALSSNPNADYLTVPFDGAANFAAQGIKLAGAESRVNLVSFEGNPDGIKRVHNGEQASDTTGDNDMAGWLSVDSLGRILVGEPAEPPSLPQQLIVQANASENGETEYGYDYEEEFESLWGK